MLRRAEILNANHLKSLTVTANYIITGVEDVILVDCTAGVVTITVPNAIAWKDLTVAIKKIDSSGNAVTISPAVSGQLIDGASSQSISSQWDVFELLADGANWQSLSIPTTVAGGALLLTGGTLTGALIINKASAAALVIGPNGATNPVFQVATNTGSQATGLLVTGAATGVAVAILATDSGANTPITFDGKGTGTIGINTLSTTSGLVTIGNTTSLAGATINGATTINSANANSLAIGPNGTTNPVFKVDSSVGSQATGIKVTGNASGSNVTITALSSGGNDAITFVSKGTGTFKFQPGTDSATAFQVINAAVSSAIFNIDTTNGRVGINASNPGQNLVIKGTGSSGTATLSSATWAGSDTTQFNFGDTSTFIKNTNSGALLFSTNSTTGMQFVDSGGPITIQSATAIPAAGNLNAGILMSSTASFGVFFGSGAPTISAAKGSIYLRSDGAGVTTRLYVATDSAGTWTNLTAGA